MIEPNIEEKASDVKKRNRRQKDKKPLDVKREIMSWIITLAVAAVVAMVVRCFIFEPVRVEGRSMLETLHHGEIVFVTKPEYLWGEPNRGDVIICRYPGRRENFVKRLIAVPGDTIEIRGTTVFINDVEQDESFLIPDLNRINHSMEPQTLHDNQYFVMGDNRDNSNDSRSASVGLISKNQIIGHVRYVIFPFNILRSVK